MSLAFPEVAVFASIHTLRCGRDPGVRCVARTCLASLCPVILGHAPDKTGHLLHFRGGLWCPVTFATVYCCSFETAKNKELCQTTQNFKPHQLQLDTPGESCLYLLPLSSSISQLTGAGGNHWNTLALPHMLEPPEDPGLFWKPSPIRLPPSWGDLRATCQARHFTMSFHCVAESWVDTSQRRGRRVERFGSQRVVKGRIERFEP